MKYILFFVVIVFSSTAGRAQITYKASDFLSIGDELVYTRALNTDLENTFEQNGPEQIWDYSQLSSIGIDTVKYIDPNDSGYQFYYCLTKGFIFNCQAKFDELTNIAEQGIDSFNLGDFNAQNVTRHFSLTDEKFSETMLGITAQLEGIDVPVAIDFEEEDVVLKFPLEFENIDTSESTFELDLSPVGFNAGIKRERQRINIVEAYGTLITPAATYDEVLKVKSVINNTDTTFLDTLMIPISSVEVEYKWYAKGEKGHVMLASGLVLGGNEVISNIQFKGIESTTSLSEVKNEHLDISFYPNPFINEVQIKSKIGKRFNLIVFDALGREVLVKKQLDSSASISLSELAPGNYFFRVEEIGKQFSLVPMTKTGH